jgi:tellurite resistance protein TehA-like permease
MLIQCDRFTWCMNAGILGTLLHQLPYRFSGLENISSIFFTLDLALYIVFSIIYALHFALYRRRAVDELLSSVADLCLFPCWSISWMTLVNFLALTVSHAPWGGYGFTIVAGVMWWIATAWVCIMLVFVFVVLIQRHTIFDTALPTLIIIPAVGVATLAAVGGVVACFARDISSGLAVPIILTSICAVGVGLFLGLMLYTYLFHQLLAKGWPAPPQTATLFILVGPMGQSAAALQLIGMAADTEGHFAAYGSGFLLDGTAAYALHVACSLLALLMTGLGAVWFVFALCAMMDRAYHRQLVWAPTWNAVIFPTGTLATSTLLLGTELHSPFFKVVTVALVVFLLLAFFVNIFFTLWRIFKGELLIVRDDPRQKGQVVERPKAS